ncbi:MAG: DUF5050 domain-containing protein [Lachnospiraceae bacterium]|nr:DUF5050 domain-containing protein [Lachnospiraceae bacterium]
MNRKWKRSGICLFLLFLFLQAGCQAEPEECQAEPEEYQAETEEYQAEPEECQAEPDEQQAVDMPVLKGTDDVFYVNCMQNGNQGNNIAYADGYYYFRSQTLDYSLCRSERAGMPSEVVADQIPGEIIALGDQLYFINVSDEQKLYRVGTDGSGLTKLSDIPMQNMAIWGDTVYFLSVYDEADDIFYQISGEEAANDRYLYSMKTDGSDCRLLVPKMCAVFAMDEYGIYYENKVDDKWVLYRCGPDGTGEDVLSESGRKISSLLAYEGALYYIADGCLARLNL